MYGFIIFGLIIVVIVVAVAYKFFFVCDDETASEKRRNVIGIIIAITIPAFFLAVNIVSQVTLEEKADIKVVESTKIVQLRDTMSSQGAFFLGFGSINGSPAYMYYIEQNDGYQLKSVDAKNVTIRYIGDSEVLDPRIEKVMHGIYYHTYWTNDWKWSESGGSYEYIIYVPDGSIKQYYLDSE